MAPDLEDSLEPVLPSANVRAASYYIARTRIRCPYCGASTPLTAVALPPAHETLNDECGEWQSVPANAFLYYLQAISAPVQAHLHHAAPNFRFDSFWVNHCEHCRRVLGDDAVHGEPGCGFTPTEEEQAAEIILTEVPAAFEAWAAGYSLEPEFFARMRRG